MMHRLLFPNCRETEALDQIVLYSKAMRDAKETIERLNKELDDWELDLQKLKKDNDELSRSNNLQKDIINKLKAQLKNQKVKYIEKSEMKYKTKESKKTKDPEVCRSLYEDTCDCSDCVDSFDKGGKVTCYDEPKK